MSDIESNLNKIKTSVYGKDVRQAIHDAIHDCYEDGRAGSTDLVARERISEIVTDSTGVLSGYSVQTESITLGTLNQSGDKYNYTGSKTFSNDVTIIDVVAYSSGYGAGIPISYKYENKVLTATATVTFEFQAGVDATIVYLQSDPISLTELVDIRVGEDGTVYDTAGDAVREQISDLKSEISGSVLTADIKSALMNCINYVAWKDNDPNASQYINALQTALYPPANLTSISAVFTQGANVIYDTDSLDTLKQYLVVTAHYSDATTETVTTYALSGSLTVGTSTITVTYGGKTTTFNVTVTENMLLYSVVDHTCDGTASTVLDTGILLNNTDRNFTILLDVTTTTSQASSPSWRIVNDVQVNDSKNCGVSIVKNTTTSSTFRWCEGTASFTDFISSTVGNVKFAIRHTAESGEATLDVLASGGTAHKYTASSSFYPTSYNVKLGGNNAATNYFKGKITCYIYKNVWTDQEVSDFLTGV